MDERWAAQAAGDHPRPARRPAARRRLRRRHRARHRRAAAARASGRCAPPTSPTESGCGPARASPDRSASDMSKRHFSSRRRPRPAPGRSRRPQRRRQDNVRAAAGLGARADPAVAGAGRLLPRQRAAALRRARPGAAARAGDGEPALAAPARPRDRRRPAAARFEQIEEVLRSPLRIATYQLLFLDRVPAHAAVHEAVEQAHQLTHRGGASFVNGVLRRIARAPRLEDWPVEGGRSGAPAGDREEPSRLPRRALARPLRHRAHARPARRQQPRRSRCTCSPSATAAAASCWPRR